MRQGRRALGDPDIIKEKLSDTVDVLVIGRGPAGAVQAAQLSDFPRIITRLIERRDGALQVGQADGVVDVLAVTDFQGIRLKAAIQSADEGNIPLIPREGGSMMRL